MKPLAAPIQSFDSNLQLRTSRAINSIAVGLEVRSLPLDSLREDTECLLEMNQEVVKIILQNRKDIWKNPELSDLVDDYFKKQPINTGFLQCSRYVSQTRRPYRVDYQRRSPKFDEEHRTVTAAKNYSKTLEELGNFRAAADPFTQEFFKAFNSVYANQISMLERLQSKKRKLDNKMGTLKAWRKVSNVIFVATFAAVLICSVVASAVSAPPVVTALVAAAAMPLGSMGSWLNSLWKKCEVELRGQRGLIRSMEIGTYIVLKDLASIRAIVERFQIKIEEISANADFAAREEEVVIAVAEIWKKVDDFIRTVRDLSVHANKCSQEISMARTLILRRIINHSSSSDQDMGVFS